MMTATSYFAESVKLREKGWVNLITFLALSLRRRKINVSCRYTLITFPYLHLLGQERVITALSKSRCMDQRNFG